MSHIKLYECANDVQHAFEELADIDEQWAIDTIEAVVGEFEHKAISVVAVALNFEAEAKMIGEHIKAMQAKKKAVENRASRLREYLHIQMTRAGIKEIKANDGTFTAKIRLNPESVEVLDEAQIPAAFIKQKVEESIDKIAIKKAIQAGQDVAGCKLVRKESLQIK